MEKGVSTYDKIKFYTNKIPAHYFYQFKEEYDFVKKTYQTYEVLKNKSKNILKLYIQIIMALYFGEMTLNYH
ncbi:MAG: hypothetical protein DRP84_03125 [Spirochaetes bacterium]|nr:MAG: hypothetical protein DRP84_03125 [Spirochaetota bacterium]